MTDTLDPERVVCPSCMQEIRRPFEARLPTCPRCGMYCHAECMVGDPRAPSDDEPPRKICNRCCLTIQIAGRAGAALSACKDQLRTVAGELEERASELEERHRELRTVARRLNRQTQPSASIAWVPLLALLLAIVVTAVLIIRGWARIPEVAIHYNVGEIIGGLLVGAGAITAAISYAIRRPRRPQEEIEE